MSRPAVRVAILLGALICCHVPGALAERADRNKPIHLEADQVTLDDTRQMGIFTGDVVMTQGTLRVSGDQFVVTQDRQGFEHGTATGTPARFRQKRDGSDEYVEGSGLRIEYNAASGIMNVYGQAHVKRGPDDVRGEHIMYSTRDQSFKVSGTQTSTQTPAANKRVTVTINPKTPAASAVQPGESLPIKPDTRLIDQDNNP